MLGFLCSGPDQVIFQRHKKNETERAAKGEEGGDKIVRTRVRYIFENRTYNSERCCLSRAHLPPPRSAMPPWRRLLYIVVLALLCFGGCSSPSFPVRYVRIPFAAPLAKLGTRVRRGVSFEAAPRTTSATAASSSAAAAALASASLPSKEESWAFPYDLLAHIGR